MFACGSFRMYARNIPLRKRPLPVMIRSRIRPSVARSGIESTAARATGRGHDSQTIPEPIRITARAR
jgi:hypothetical protein